MRRFVAIPAALILLLLGVTGVAAYVLWGWFNTSAIDTDANGQADLSVCYDVSTNSPIYVNRGQIAQEIAQWHTASVGAFSSNAICNNDGSNFEMRQFDWGGCEPGAGTYARTQNFGDVGRSQVKIWFNPQCIDDFDWYDTDGIDAGKISGLANALHEVGHALGLEHSNVVNAVMDDLGPNNCSFVGNDFRLAFDDADGYRDRYPGISDTTTAFPADTGCDP